jgi:hypothetical protein
MALSFERNGNHGSKFSGEKAWAEWDFEKVIGCKNG